MRSPWGRRWLPDSRDHGESRTVLSPRNRAKSVRETMSLKWGVQKQQKTGNPTYVVFTVRQRGRRGQLLSGVRDHRSLRCSQPVHLQLDLDFGRFCARNEKKISAA